MVTFSGFVSNLNQNPNSKKFIFGETVWWQLKDRWRTTVRVLAAQAANWQYWKAIAGAEADTSSATLAISPEKNPDVLLRTLSTWKYLEYLKESRCTSAYLEYLKVPESTWKYLEYLKESRCTSAYLESCRAIGSCQTKTSGRPQNIILINSASLRSVKIFRFCGGIIHSTGCYLEL